MKMTQSHYLSLIDNSLKNSNKDIKTRYAKTVILSNIASKYNDDLFIKYLSVMQILLFGTNNKCNLMMKDIGDVYFLCEAAQYLGYEHFTLDMLSESKESERELVSFYESLSDIPMDKMINYIDFDSRVEYV